MNYSEIIKPYKELIVFLVKCVLLYALWLLLRKYIFFPESATDKFLISQITRSTAFILNLLGYETYIDNTYVGIAENPGVSIAFNCNGISLMYLFVSFILAFSGKWKHKLIFIPIGLLIIHIFNIIRTALLAIIIVYKPNWTEFNHKYTFTATIYIVIFILWVIWVNYFSTSKKIEN
jgi:exosortase family protein XrtF